MLLLNNLIKKQYCFKKIFQHIVLKGKHLVFLLYPISIHEPREFEYKCKNYRQLWDSSPTLFHFSLLLIFFSIAQSIRFRQVQQLHRQNQHPQLQLLCVALPYWLVHNMHSLLYALPFSYITKSTPGSITSR